MWIERNNTEKILDSVKNRPVTLLTGIRQAGKSTLLQNLFKDAEYVTLDKVLYAQEAIENPSDFLNRFTGQVIIDEVQYAPSLLRDLKIMVDNERSVNGKWVLTGSQQFQLMQKASESLAGRVRILNLGTLSASELNNSDLRFNKYDLLWKGGFPEVWAANLDANDFFDDYIQTYLERDLKQILNVTSLRDFRRFLSILATRVGQLLNYSEVSRDVGVAVNTIKSWVNALEISGLIVLLPPYHKNIGKQLIKSPKLYFCDNGLVAALLNISSIKSLNQSMYQGSLWENFILTEYIKEGFVAGRNLFYIRDKNGVEIDFVIENEGKVTFVEAKNSERPDKRKLNFHKISPLFNTEIQKMVACNINEKGLFSMKDYSIYNPLFGKIYL